MRRGLFQGVPSPEDNRLQRIQDQLKTVVDTLTADHDVLSSPVATFQVSGPIVAGSSLAVFRGATGQTLTLPLAKAQGASVGALVAILNISPNIITVVPVQGDTLNGGKTLTQNGGTVVMFACDGVSAWQAIRGPGATDLALTALAPLVSETIPAGMGVVVPGSYTIALGTKLFIGLGARMRIL